MITEAFIIERSPYHYGIHKERSHCKFNMAILLLKLSLLFYWPASNWRPAEMPTKELLTLISSRIKTQREKGIIREGKNPGVQSLLLKEKQNVLGGGGSCHTHPRVHQTSPCTCPRRQLPPPKPIEPPFPATEANRIRLPHWLLDYYKSSTFNKCEHQPLPLMAGVPMRLMVDPNTGPHCPPYPSSCPTPLARRCQSWLWPWCVPGSSRTSTSRRACHLVPPHGNLCKKERQTLVHSQLPGTKPPGRTWNPSHTGVPFIRLAMHPLTKRKLYLTAGMDITVSPFTQMIATSPHSLRHGVDTATRLHLRIT